MRQVLEELSATRAKVRASRRLESRSGDAHVGAEHELFDYGAPDTAASQVMDRHCYVCRRPVPTSREDAKDGRWCDIRFGEIAIGALCANCSP